LSSISDEGGTDCVGAAMGGAAATAAADTNIFHNRSPVDQSARSLGRTIHGPRTRFWRAGGGLTCVRPAGRNQRRWTCWKRAWGAGIRLGYGRVCVWRAKHAISLGHVDYRPSWLGLEPGRKLALPLGLLLG
jgi:hypothetical protein